MTVYEKLLEAKDDRYREFQARLVPNIPSENILGVRTPEMRKIAREVSGFLISPDLRQIVLYISGIIHFPQMFPDIHFAQPDI